MITKEHMLSKAGRDNIIIQERSMKSDQKKNFYTLKENIWRD